MCQRDVSQKRKTPFGLENGVLLNRRTIGMEARNYILFIDDKPT